MMNRLIPKLFYVRMEDGLHAEIAAKRPALLHPNLKDVQTRPWGAKEFAVLDASGVCVVFRQW